MGMRFHPREKPYRMTRSTWSCAGDSPGPRDRLWRRRRAIDHKGTEPYISAQLHNQDDGRAVSRCVFRSRRFGRLCRSTGLPASNSIDCGSDSGCLRSGSRRPHSSRVGGYVMVLLCCVNKSRGVPRTPNRSANLGDSSTLTMTTLSRPANSRASRSSAGATIRQGPHHGAQNSTTTGNLNFSATAEKSESSVSYEPGQRLVAHRTAWSPFGRWR